MTVSTTGFPPVTIYDVVGITNAMPARVTLDSVTDTSAFYIVNGMTITFSNVLGMYEVNRQRYVIGSLDVDTLSFSLYTIQGKPADTTSFNTYTAGGQINIISYPAQAGQPPGLMYNTQPITI